MDRRTLRVGGVPVRVRTLTGRGERTFVLVHGIGVSSKYFEPLARRLHVAGDVLLIDLPGFGGLPQPRNPLSIAGFARTVSRAIEEVQAPDPVLVGHSMGAQVVTDLLVREQLTGPAVLIGAPVNPAEPRVWQQARRFAQSSAHETRRTRLVAMRAYVRCGPAWFLEVLPAMMRYPISEQLTRVRADVLVLRGERDLVAPAEWLDAMEHALPQARAATIPGASHAVVYDHSDEVADLILEHVGYGADSAPTTRP